MWHISTIVAIIIHVQAFVYFFPYLAFAYSYCKGIHDLSSMKIWHLPEIHCSKYLLEQACISSHTHEG